jgi:sec-independent protein translocase protein TatA
MPGTTELLIIAGVIFVLFGATAIPKFARSIGLAKKEFNKASEDDKKEEIIEKKSEEASE